MKFEFQYLPSQSGSFLAHASFSNINFLILTLIFKRIFNITSFTGDLYEQAQCEQAQSLFLVDFNTAR